jgi:transcription initiation factor TFIIIB Brf1 subunit/transcription initiation factor TFIIB
MREMIKIAREAGTSKETMRAAVKLFRATMRADTGIKHVMTGRSYTVFEISSLYIAARGSPDERTMQHYIEAARRLTDARQTITERELNRTVAIQKNILHITIPPHMTAEQYIQIIADRVDLGELTREKALEILVECADIPTIRKRHPRSVAAGMIYAAIALYHTDEITQSRLAEMSNTSITTIRLIFRAARRRNTKKKVAFVVKRNA